MKTFKQIRAFNLAVDSYLARDKNNAQTKMGYALKKISENQINKITKEYQKLYNDLHHEMVWKKQVDLALTDKITGAVMTAAKGSDRPFLFDKEGLKETVGNERAFNETFSVKSDEFDAREFAIEPHYIKDIPEDLTSVEKEAFVGFVIEPPKTAKASKA